MAATMPVANGSDTSSDAAHKILLLTNVERGEANVFLATCRTLIQANPDVEIHFASFPGLERDVAAVWEEARRETPEARFPIVYHAIGGLKMGDGLQRVMERRGTKLFKGIFPVSFMKPLGFTVTRQAIQDMIPILTPYDGQDFLDVFHSVVDIVKAVNANVVIVDSLMSAGLTACTHLGVNWMVLSPNAIKEFAGPYQPRAASLWKFPASFSGYMFPVPWYNRLLNVYYALYVARLYLTDADRKAAIEYVKTKAGVDMKTPVNLLRDRSNHLKILVSTLPELDFPLVKPPHVFPCGPIVRSAPPVSESDPELLQWLARGPVIYLNLGSLFLIPENNALELAKTLKVVLDACKTTHPTLQCIFKLKKLGEYEVGKGSPIYNVLREEIEADRVRIVDWVKAEPISVLQSGHVVCSIHHGGANSYNEAAIAGVPQVVLPQWTDCYDYALRVEHHGIGRWGTRHSKPEWSTPELSRALLHVIQGPEAELIKQRATDLAVICARNGSGAAVAARIILEECAKSDAEGGSTAIPEKKIL